MTVRPRIIAAVLGGALGLVVCLSGVAFAYWLVTVTSGSNYAEATAQIMPTGAVPTTSVTPASGQTVTITFAQSSTSGGTSLTSYAVNRYASGSTSSASISGSCSVSAGLATCTDAPGAGTWQYADVPELASSTWVGTESAKSVAVVVQALPTVSVSAATSVVFAAAITPSATLAAATTSPAPAPGGSISFSVFGPQVTAPSSCTGTGWTTVGSAVTVTANGSYNASTTYAPTTAGTYWWYASYTGDTHNASAVSSCSTTSTVVHVAIAPSSLPGATVYATGYSQSITASGGTAPYTYTVTSGSLPNGMALSSGGVISGTVTGAGQTGSHTFTVTATDHAGLTGTQTYTLVVTAPTLTLSALSNPMGETSDTAAIATSGGVSGYTYAVTSGSLPTGLSLSSAGSFSGSPSAAGTYAFTVTATDANGYTGSRSYTLIPVSPTITVTPSTLSAATVYVAYSKSLSSSGGVSGYTYAVTSGTLPAGLSVSTAGVLSGTITAAAQNGSYSFTVTVTDADGFTGTISYTLTVNPPVITLTPAAGSLGSATLGYSKQLGASSALSGDTFSFAVTSGALPTGFTMTTGGLIQSGGSLGLLTTYNFTVTATDKNGYTGSAAYSITVVLTL